MKISLICIGKKMPSWIQAGIEHYQKQLPKSLGFSLVAIDAQNRKHQDIQKIKESEGELLIKATQGATLVIALDEHGKQHSTKQMASQLDNWQQNGEHVALLIGGADGLSQACRDHAQQTWGLSNLTLPHSIARLLIVEQLYRAHSLLTNHPYHRE